MNIRQNAFIQSALFRLAEQCRTEQAEIDDFPRYGTTLNPVQLAQIDKIADTIVQSAKHTPISAVLVLGHADVDYSIANTDARRAKELSVSNERAENGMTFLRDALKRRIGGKSFAAMLPIKPVGKGATQLKVANPRTEAERRRNRRVVFQWMRCAPSEQPPVTPLPDHPHDPPNPEDNPNAVFAGTNYKVKVRRGMSFGEVAGGFWMRLGFWDTGNKRYAEYWYWGSSIEFSLGLPISRIGETSWQGFTLANAVAVNELSPRVTHEAGSAGDVGGLVLRFFFDGEPTPKAVKFDTGGSDTSAFAADTGSDPKGIQLIKGSVIVYNGGDLPGSDPSPPPDFPGA